MTTRIALIHTVTSLVPVFKELITELIPDADLYHVVDESLLQNNSAALSIAPVSLEISFLEILTNLLEISA